MTYLPLLFCMLGLAPVFSRASAIFAMPLITSAECFLGLKEQTRWSGVSTAPTVAAFTWAEWRIRKMEANSSPGKEGGKIIKVLLKIYWSTKRIQGKRNTGLSGNSNKLNHPTPLWIALCRRLQPLWSTMSTSALLLTRVVAILSNLRESARSSARSPLLSSSLSLPGSWQY